MIGFRGAGQMLKRRNDRRLAARRLTDEKRDARAEGRKVGRKERDDEYTLYVAAPDEHGAFKIGEQPRHEFVRIALAPPRAMDLEEIIRTRPYDMPTQLVTFRAVKHGRPAGTGQQVYWWSWELCR